MFTGIITDIGKVTSFEKVADAVWQLQISTVFDVDTIDIGASIACNGVCLTVVEKSSGLLLFELSPETVNLTTYKNIKVGDDINLERSLKVGDELGGHYVSGHVDGIAEISNIQKEGENWVVAIAAPSKELAQFIARKGSIAINGVSLTVNKVSDMIFYINIIPHTLKNTNLSKLDTGKLVNLEVDIFARYVQRINYFDDDKN